MYPSLCFASWSVTSDRTAGKKPPGGPEAMGPSPFPASPWHTRQYVSYRNFPRLSDSDVRVRGSASRSALLRSAAGGAPVTGTVPGTGARLRLYGLKLRWWRMVANQPMWCTTSSGLQARAAKTARAARAARGLRTAHLLGAGLPQQRLHLARPVGGAGVEDASQLVPGDGRVAGEVVVAARAQPPHRVDCGVELPEHAEHPRGGRRVEDRAQRGERVGQPHACTARDARWGGGRTSLTSEIDTEGKFFTNKRNHMKNHPKLPAMMPQSAHVAVYV